MKKHKFYSWLNWKLYIWKYCKSILRMDTLNRFDRIVAILIQLQSKKIVRAQELADRFNVSLRTIYRDIRTLESSGVPIVAEAGVGYSIMEGYRLPPIMFTKEEAGSFVAAEKLMQQYTDKSLGGHFESAMLKVKSTLRSREKEWIETLESQISVSPTQSLFNINISNALELFIQSIAEKRQVFFKYHALQQIKPNERYLEPIGIFYENNYWYIYGYCHLRNDYRQFRTDRVLEIKATTLEFSRAHASMDELRLKRTENEKVSIIILVDNKVARFMENSKRHYGFISQKPIGDKVEMTFLSESSIGFVRWYLSFADFATIIEPLSLKKTLKDIIIEMNAKLDI
ncbi:helix-turn-helix transcriptional regulator [Crocinitomix catalasitica]|uniref:helix-turn-helix transcriptional regulator n=1 Tax=Crocinitomix catalasitica TaxID=184607 RepID=UPI000487476A|nr:WYL domain-containing protein [Crocinitomix catalasitica]